MRVVFAGTPKVALPSLDAVAASSHELVGVVTRPDAAAGRGRRLVASPVAQRAEELGVPVLKPGHPREPEFQDALRELAPDCCPVVAYGALLPRSALDIPRLGWVNLHFSCLPALRGAAPVQHAIWAGEEVTGATTFRIVEAMERRPDLRRHDRGHPTARHRRRAARPARRGWGRVLVATLDGLETDSLDAREQPADGVSLAPKITVDDARVDWSEPALAVDRRVRACTPAPGAWTTLDDDRLKLGPVRFTDTSLPPGEVAVGKQEVLVGTGTIAVRLGEVQAVGKRPMPAADWARGVRLAAGTLLGRDAA